MKKGITLIELLMTIGLLAALTLTIGYVFRVVLLSWSSQEKRAGIDINLDRALEEMSRDLREAGQAQSGNNEIRFRQGLSSYYIYYFYNPQETYPPVFSQSSYQLKKEALSAGINGTFTYGAGQPIANDVLAVPVSGLSLSSNLITVDLSVKRADETIRARTQIRPRNI